MSKFDQLSATYKAKELYWDGLLHMVSRVRSDFCTYLGVPETDHIPVGRETVPVVSTGVVDGRGSFSSVSDDELPRDGRSILFSLRLAYGITTSAPKADPAPFVVFNLAIKSTDDGSPVTLRDGEEKEFNGPLYTLLFDELFSRTVESIRK